MKAARIIGTLVLVLLIAGGIALAQDGGDDPNMAAEQKAPTVMGGTGLFNTFSTRTLCKGEFNFAVFWNNFETDPGDLSINQVPFNVTLGLTNRWEIWADWNTWQQVTSRNPFLLSGYQLSAVRFFGNPFTILGPPQGGGFGSAAFFPGTGALGGGILPALGRFGTPLAFPSSILSPGGPGKPDVTGLGPAIDVNRANFYQGLPFFGEVNFLGFNSLGQPMFGPRESSNGTSDIYLGTKYSIIDPDHHWFSLALGGYFKIPVSTSQAAEASGRTNGAFEGGPMLMLGQETSGHRLRFYENVGYIHTQNIKQDGINVLSLKDELLAGGGISVGIDKHVEALSEVYGTWYVGGGTPDLAYIDPVYWNIGLRFFFRNGAISFGGGYRRLLNKQGAITLPVVEFKTLGPPFFTVPFFTTTTETFPSEGTSSGFVAYVSVGSRKACPPPPVPTCVVEASPATVNKGEALKLTARPTTPGYPDAKVTYDYHWDVKDAQGRTVSVSGTGASVDVPTGALACGTYSVTSSVRATVPAVDCPTDCVTTGTTTCNTSFTITEPPCPAISCSATANPTTVKPGERVTLNVTGQGEGNLSYSWSTSAGTLSSTTGSEVTLDTTGVAPGTITVTVNTNTDKTHCGDACPGGSCAVTVAVSTPEQVPVSPISPCGPIFFPFNSARINNEHKACLDEIALRLQQDPRSSLVVDGHRDSSERVGISLTRANNARDYLVNEKGIDAARITVRNYGDTCPHESGDPALNRRVEFWLLPEGATMAGVDSLKKCAAGSTPQVLTNEEPAPSTDLKPRRRRRRHH
ncbi:MAG TPA: OmpA family protein [Blastocatellia bacterium]